MMRIKGFCQSHFREGAGGPALKKRLFWMYLTRYGSHGVATGVSDAPPAAFSTHGLGARCASIFYEL